MCIHEVRLNKNKMMVILPLFFFLLFFIFFLDEQTMAMLAAPRPMLVLALLFWARCECFIRLRVDAACRAVEAVCHSVKADNKTKEDRGLGETVVGLSDYHELLCEIRDFSRAVMTLSDQRTLLHDIRGEVRRSAKCSKDVLDRISRSSSVDSVSSSDCTSRSHVEKARKAFRRSGMSEGCISVPKSDLWFDPKQNVGVAAVRIIPDRNRRWPR